MEKTIVASYLVEELERANETNRATFASPHEGYAVLLEEVHELFDEVRKKHPEKDKLREEAIQIGAMAIKFILSLENWGRTEAKEGVDHCDECGAKVLMGRDDIFLERGTYGIPKGQCSKMVCGHCYETRYAGKE